MGHLILQLGIMSLLFRWWLHNVPVIPLVVTFREPKGIRRIFKKKKDVTVKILKPIKYEGQNDSKKDSVEKLKEEVHKVMEENMN